MDNEQAANVPAVKRFVREVIGCDCPDDVFRDVRIRRGSSAVQAFAADCELRIGGRLMIVVTSEPTALSDSLLAQALAEGRRARDDAGFNRFRLVVGRGRSPSGPSCCPGMPRPLTVSRPVPDFFQQGADTRAR